MAESDAFYNGILAKVNPLLSQLGTTYTVRADGAYDPNTRTVVDGATRTVTGLVADSQTVNSLGSQIFPVDEKSQSWIGKRNLLLAAAAAPKPDESVLVDGKWFSMAKVKELKPADIVLLYILDITL